MSASRKEKIASSFIDVQLSVPESKLHSNADRYRFNEYSSSQSVAGVLQRPPHYSSNLTSAVYRQRSTLSSKGVTVLQKQESIPKIQKDSFLLSCTKEYMPPLSHDSDSEYDTDLEEDFPPKRCPPPTHSNPRSQVDFYKAVCSRVGIIPISSYEKNIDKEECILNYRKINGVESKALSLPLQVNRSIHRLELQENLLSTIGAKWISQLIQENTTLTKLNLADNKGAFNKPESIQNLCNALISNKSITQLDLSGNHLHDKCAPAISYLLQNTRSLRFLNLSHNELGSEGGNYIAIGLSRNESLHTLDLSWNHLRLAGTSSLAFSLQENVTLQKLYLSMNGFGLTGIISLATALKANSSLLELDISDNRIPIEGAAELGKVFSINDSLQVLKIGQNPIQTHGSYAFIKFLLDSKNTSLQVVDMQKVTVLDVFMDAVMEIRTHNPTFQVRVGTIIASPAIKLETGKNKEISDANPLMIVVTYMESQRMRIVDLFKTWDADNSMSLTRDEFKEGLKSINTPLTEAQLDELIQMLDEDGNGEIELSELIQSIERDHKGIRRKAAEAAKAEGPFPRLVGSAVKKKGEDRDILTEVEDMLDEASQRGLSFECKYGPALMSDENSKYYTPFKYRQTQYSGRSLGSHPTSNQITDIDLCF